MTGESNYQKDLITEQENHIAGLNNQIENYKKIELERDGLLKYRQLLLQQIDGLQNEKANLEATVAGLSADLASLTSKFEDLSARFAAKSKLSNEQESIIIAMKKRATEMNAEIADLSQLNVER